MRALNWKFTRVIDPDLRCEKRNCESNPECNAEEFVRCEPAERKEHPDNRPRGGYSKGDAESTNHPLAMSRHFLAAYVPVSLN